MEFKIGEKVVCIDDKDGKISKEKHLKKGEIYTVMNVILTANKRIDIWVDGIYGGWDSSRFRKLDYEFADNLLTEIKESVTKLELQN